MGPEIDTDPSTDFNLGDNVKHIWTDNPTPKRPDIKRSSERRVVTLPARLTWKDQRGSTRFATVVTRNVSDFGVYVECQSPVSIPLFRLVQFQLERNAGSADALPTSLQQGRVLGAVYRVSPPSGSRPQGLALRLMIDPRHAAVPAQLEARRATA
jgi:hypothetical protein